MENLSFEMLNQGWNAIRTSGAPNLRKLVPGLIDPARIILQRVSELPDTITIMFKGFTQALDNVEEEAPILKRAILAWVKKFAEAQIERTGDPDSFIIRVTKTPNPAQMAENKKWQEIEEALDAGSPERKLSNTPLAHIINVRKPNGR